MSKVDGDLHVTGSLTCNKFTPPASCVDDSSIKAGAAIATSKLLHQHRVPFSQANATAVAETRVIYVCYGATGTIGDFRAGSIVACTGNATITVDIRKNGTTVLAAPIVLDNTNSSRLAEAAAVTTTGLVAGDVLEVVVTVNAGTGVLGTGVFASLTAEEAPV